MALPLHMHNIGVIWHKSVLTPNSITPTFDPFTCSSSINAFRQIAPLGLLAVSEEFFARSL